MSENDTRDDRRDPAEGGLEEAGIAPTGVGGGTSGWDDLPPAAPGTDGATRSPDEAIEGERPEGRPSGV